MRKTSCPNDEARHEAAALRMAAAAAPVGGPFPTLIRIAAWSTARGVESALLAANRGWWTGLRGADGELARSAAVEGGGTMPHQMHLVQHAKAPADAVWAVLVDIEGAKATLSGVTKTEVLTPGEYTEGFRWRETRKMMGKEQTEEMWVASIDAPRSTTIRSNSGGAAYTTRFTLVPAGGGTDVTIVLRRRTREPGRRLAVDDGGVRQARHADRPQGDAAGGP